MLTIRKQHPIHCLTALPVYSCLKSSIPQRKCEIAAIAIRTTSQMTIHKGRLKVKLQIIPLKTTGAGGCGNTSLTTGHESSLSSSFIKSTEACTKKDSNPYRAIVDELRQNPNARIYIQTYLNTVHHCHSFFI